MSIGKLNGLCERRRGKRHVWPRDIVGMYVVLLTELRWRRSSTGWVVGFPFGVGAGFCSQACEDRVSVTYESAHPPRSFYCTNTLGWNNLSSLLVLAL